MSDKPAAGRRLAFAIAHYFAPDGLGFHGSRSSDPAPRIAALRAGITALHGLFGGPAVEIDWAGGRTIEANGARPQIEILVVTTLGLHLIESLKLPQTLYSHIEVDCDPLDLAVAARVELGRRLGAHDYYGFLEDDLRLHDPWFFHKLAWFNRNAGEDCVLLPNRFEASVDYPYRKVYADGDIRRSQSSTFWNDKGPERLRAKVLGRQVGFRRVPNAHAGCWFLSASQMERWARTPYFAEVVRGFVGPLESGATLALLRTFGIYKPEPPNADFLEIEHQDERFMRIVSGLAVERP